jgi:prophage antirepressor-like protein
MKYKLYVDLCSDLDHYMVSPAILFNPPQKSSDRITTIGIDSGLLCDFSHSFCASGCVQGMNELPSGRIRGGFTQEFPNILVGFEMIGNVEFSSFDHDRCSRIHSTSASSIRVCQPLPVARNDSTTSRDRRMVMRSLVTAERGRPTRFNFANSASVSGKASGSDIAAAVMAASSSGVLSRIFRPDLVVKYFCIVSLLPVIGFAQTDDAPSIGAIHEGHKKQPLIQRHQPAHSWFAVIFAIIYPDHCGIPFKLIRQSHRYAVLGYIGSVFGWIKGNLHANNCTYINYLIQVISVCTFDKPSIQAYPSHATDTSVVGTANPDGAAIGREPYSLAAIFSSDVPLMAGRAGKPKGLPVLHRICSPVSVCHHFLQRVMAVNNPQMEHIMTNTNSGAFAPVVFQFQSTNIRTFADDNGEPWFCANDVCEVLGYANSRQAVQKNCLEKGVSKRDTLTGGGNQELTFINEGNLYRLIVKSRKPEAEKFEQLVMDEILPTIRKTGSYHKQESLPPITADQIEKLIEKQLRKSLPNPDCLLPPDQAKEIMNRLDRLGKMFHPFSDQFSDVMGVIRALRGCNPKLGLEQPGYKAVIEPKSK